MDLNFIDLLIICPLVFCAGFVDAVAGGGGLISLPAYLIAGLPAHYAIGTNKLSSGMGTALATFRYARLGYIPWKDSIGCVICALIGATCGSNLALLINDHAFKVIMLVILPLTAVFITRSRILKISPPPFSQLKTAVIAMIISLTIGAYDGFYGPGTGTFLILLLISVAHMKVQSANGISKATNLATNVAALAVFLYNGKVLILLGFIAGIFSIAGNWIGSSFFEKKGIKAVKPLMLAVMAIFFIRITWELWLK
ncbi:MAG: sulfite exporter TauE/SafE family protein [Burkholderiales bacterium]|nr:sulfite exporter TauE/SafE family protein [Burkholderiales bacterium]